MNSYKTSLLQSSYGAAYFWGAVILATAASHAGAQKLSENPTAFNSSYTSSATPPSAPTSDSLALGSVSVDVDESDITAVSISVYQKLLDEQKTLEPEFSKVLEDNFWDLCSA